MQINYSSYLCFINEKEMNNELKKILLEYANDDTQIAIDNGIMAITGTKKGVITLKYENNQFQAWNNQGEQLTGEMNRENMMNWIIEQYVVEQA